MGRVPTTIIALLLILLASSTYAWRTEHAELAELRGSLAIADRIVRAVDGDTVELERLGKTRIRGINAPELYERTPAGGWKRLAHPDPRATTAYEWLRSLEGSLVRVQPGKQPRDHYGRALAHLYLLPDGPDLAGNLLRHGWADVLALHPNAAREADWRRSGASAGSSAPAILPGR